MTILANTDACQRVREWKSSNDTLQNLTAFLLDRFRSARRILLVGSVLRAPFLRSATASKDIDVVVDGVDFGQLKALPDGRLNFFGGIVFRFQEVAIDIWPLADTYHIREFGGEPTIEAFIRGAPFNLDKVAFDLRDEILYDGGFLEGLAAEQIRYAPAHRYLEHVQAARCVLLNHKTGFALDDTAKSLLLRVACDLEADRNCVANVRRFLHQSLDDGAADRVISDIQALGRRILPSAARVDHTARRGETVIANQSERGST